MKQTTYTCDRCGKTSEHADFLTEIAVGRKVGAGYASYEIYGPSGEWCRDCLIATGLVPPVRGSNVEPPSTQPTIEDIVRQLIREETGP